MSDSQVDVNVPIAVLNEKCNKGHNILSCGRSKWNGICNSCAKVNQKRYQQSPKGMLLRKGIKQRYSQTKSIAKKRNLEFNLIIEDYSKIIKMPCYYCGINKFGIESGCGLDRIDNKLGYITGNVLSCCGECNNHRQDTWTVNETQIAIKAVSEYRNERNNKKN